MTASVAPVETRGLRRVYGERVALDGLDLTVGSGELFGLLGPNGGGKTTLFRILTTALGATAGEVRVLGHPLPADARAVRRRIGVVFQSPSLDAKLTVRENLTHQGHLYGLRGADLIARIDRHLEWVGLTDRSGDRVETLSGGLARRAELAKGLLHDPDLLLLDEPSTGLDPAARQDLWEHLVQLRDERGVTCLVTTHLMEEAERCDRVGILDLGRLVALGTPEELRASIGGQVVTVTPSDPQDAAALAGHLLERILAGAAPTSCRAVGGAVKIESPHGAALVPQVLDACGERAAAVAVGRPTLLDVFLAKTGRRFE